MSPNVADVILKAACSLWMVAVSAWDVRQQRVPNALVLPVMLVALIWQIYRLIDHGDASLYFALVAWVILFLLWQGHIIGGGDAKVLMALFAMFPSLSFLLLFSLIKLIVTIPFVLRKYKGQRPADLIERLRARATSDQVLPNQQELQTHGQSNCWTYCLPGLIYLWWLL